MASKASEIALVPYCKLEGQWTLPESLVFSVGKRAWDQGVLETVFINGGVTSSEDFLWTMQRPTNLPVFAFVNKICIGVAWLNNISGNHAFGHFLFLKGGRGETARDAGKLILKYWLAFSAEDGPILDVVLGLVPSFNERAIKFVQDLGMTKLGEIPKIAKGGPGTLLYLAR